MLKSPSLFSLIFAESWGFGVVVVVGWVVVVVVVVGLGGSGVGLGGGVVGGFALAPVFPWLGPSPAVLALWPARPYLFELPSTLHPS